MTDEESFLISKMELVLNQEGVTSTEDELFLTDFEITCDYENILKTLSEAMFNLMPFSAVPFEDKLNYLKEVFEAWQESTQLGEEHLPLLPDFEWDDEDYVEFIVPFYQNRDKAEDQVEEFSKNESVEKAEFETHELEEKEIPEISKESSEEVIEEDKTSEKSIQEEDGTKDPLSLIPLEEKIDFKPYSFTYFELKTTSPDVFVPLSITENIEAINQEVDQMNRESNMLQKLIFDQKMARFEVEKKNQLAMHLKNLDKRVQLKNELVHNAARRLEEALAFETKRAKDKEELDLLEAKKSYEQRVATIKHESSFALEEKLKQLKNESKNQVHNEVLTLLADETVKLKEFLDEALLDLHIEMKKEAERVQQELHRLSEAQQKIIETYYKQNLALPLNVELHTLVKPKEGVTNV
ncbi:MAG: MICOS complex subunit MIC60 [Lactococcus lactis]|nr:MICOS complex subunit MIC60 [Lactococcus lactis]